MALLPSHVQLQRLPLRAIDAYAARAARRIRSVLRDAIDDKIVDDALSIVESVASVDHLDRQQAASAAFSASKIAGAAANLKMQKRETHLAVFCLLATTRTACAVLLGALEPSRVAHYAAYAARAAAQAASCAGKILDGDTATAGHDAIARDYEKLLGAFGEHENVIVGQPIDLSATSPLWRGDREIDNGAGGLSW